VRLPFYDAMYDSRHQARASCGMSRTQASRLRGYARPTGTFGACAAATSGHRTTNLVTGLVDAIMDSISHRRPYRAISSKLSGMRRLSGSRHLGITRSGTKPTSWSRRWPNCRVRFTRVHIASIDALASAGYITKDAFQAEPLRASSIHLPGYSRLHTPKATRSDSARVRKPGGSQVPWVCGRRIIHAGAHDELAPIVEMIDSRRHHIDGAARLPANHPNFITMPEWHAAYAAIWA